MSELTLGSVSFEGFARIEQIGPVGMIAFRGDLEKDEVRAAIGAVTGFDLPGQRGILMRGDWAVGWMSPDEVIILLPYTEVSATLDSLEDRLSSHHHLSLDISDARAVFRISGARAREVLAKLSPVDLSSQQFGPGEIRRTRAAQVAAAFWLDEDGVFTLICFRSVARYVSDLLSISAQSGSEIDLYMP